LVAGRKCAHHSRDGLPACLGRIDSLWALPLLFGLMDLSMIVRHIARFGKLEEVRL
jgi:hypothetical protein